MGLTDRCVVVTKKKTLPPKKKMGPKTLPPAPRQKRRPRVHHAATRQRANPLGRCAGCYIYCGDISNDLHQLLCTVHMLCYASAHHTPQLAVDRRGPPSRRSIPHSVAVLKAAGICLLLRHGPTHCAWAA
jgi:hypothetical protein